MGGYGSGSRNRWAPKTDEFHKLDLAGFRREWFEGWRSGTMTWSRGDHVTGRISYRLALDHMRLIYTSGPEGNRQSIDERFDLAFTNQPFGGRRMWIVCPSCGKRCRVLYGGTHFRCRSCYRATYPSQYEAIRVAGLSVAERVRDKLGGEAGLMNPFPRKPKGMHWRTYRQLQAREELAQRNMHLALMGRLRL